MFVVGAINFDFSHALPFYALLGVLCGLAAIRFTKLLYWTEDQFQQLPIDELWWPAIGALGGSIIGYFVPRVLGMGYDTIGDILNARFFRLCARQPRLGLSLGQEAGRRGSVGYTGRGEGCSRSHMAIVIPQPNRRSRQIVFIAKRTETGGA